MKRIIIIPFFFIYLFSHSQNFTLKSKDLEGQFTIRNMGNLFGCDGENKSPELYWENAPRGTESFAITMYDKDAPTGSGFWHWVVYNIPPDIFELKEGAGNISQKNLPDSAINGMNDAGLNGYIGPCPPPAQNHLYLITVYALKTKLKLNKLASAAMIGFMLNSNSLAKSSIAIYGQH